MKRKVRIHWGRVALFALIVVLVFVGLAFVLSRCFPFREELQDRAPQYVKKEYLKKNQWSRPGDRLTEVNDIVIHYVANPGTSAEANRNYFNNLSNPKSNPAGTKASSHFIVGLSGEVIQCIPLTEIAYANAPRNGDTISIEVCHPDESGQFAEETTASVVRLTADLLKEYGLSAEHVIRHHDVSGKACPKYYVEHEDAWEQLKADIREELEKKE